MTVPASYSKTNFRNYHVIGVKEARKAKYEQSYNRWTVFECENCKERFSVGPPRGIIPQHAETVYLKRLKSRLTDDHANERKHQIAFDLGA